MDTGTRDIILDHGAFVENFNYDKWQAMVHAGKLDVADVAVPDINDNENQTAEDGKGE